MESLALGEKVLRYPWLSEEEQRQVREAVRHAPEWQELLDYVQELAPLLKALHPAGEDPMSEEMLAFYLLTHQRSPHPLPSSLAAYFARLEAQLEADDALRQRCEKLRRRLEQIGQEFDARAHFEQLTGRLLEQEAVPASHRMVPIGALHEADEQRAGRSVIQAASDRPARRAARRNVWRWVERGAFLVVVLSALYGGLFFWSQATQSELERLGFISPTMLETDSYRGEATGAGDLDVLYEEALQAIRKAHTSWLGLFPRYDGAQLARAESLLVMVGTSEAATEALRQEALFLLGKVRLLRHDVAGARQALQEAAAWEGPYTEEARRLLQQLTCLEESAEC